MADADSGNVRYGVEGAGRNAADLDPDITRMGLTARLSQLDGRNVSQRFHQDAFGGYVCIHFCDSEAGCREHDRDFAS